MHNALQYFILGSIVQHSHCLSPCHIKCCIWWPKLGFSWEGQTWCRGESRVTGSPGWGFEAASPHLLGEGLPQLFSFLDATHVGASGTGPNSFSPETIYSLMWHAYVCSLQFGSITDLQEEFKDINQDKQIEKLHGMLKPHLLRSEYLLRFFHILARHTVLQVSSWIICLIHCHC